jgi:hypothetical protein
VLAFEPTFVEIRHVETGAMAQIIQGSNLRLLFADMPPSTTHSAASNSAASSSFAAPSQVSYNPYAAQAPSQFGAYNPYNGYGHPQAQAPYPGWPQQQGSAYSRNGYATSQHGYQSQGMPSSAPPPPPKTGFGRDEIVLVSDDRVMTIHLGGPADSAGDDPQGLQAPLPPLPTSGAASVYSVAR